MQDFWDNRYRQEAFAYGETPNLFLKAALEDLAPGNILFPAEGEGRNAVYAAQKGWNVAAFDQSAEGKKKAQLLAQRLGVAIDYLVNSFQDLPYTEGQFEAIGLIYAHFPAERKSEFHQQLATYLKPGGILIFEAFSKKHLEYVTRDERVGGPRDIHMLFSTEEIQHDFQPFEILLLEEKVIELQEGLHHNGTGSVLRFIGRKLKT